MRDVPEALRWVLWDLDLSRVDADRDAPAVLARVLEHGRLSDVREALAFYGVPRVLQFFRDAAHPLISERTRSFWHAFFGESERWPTREGSKSPSAAPWVD